MNVPEKSRCLIEKRRIPDENASVTPSSAAILTAEANERERTFH